MKKYIFLVSIFTFVVLSGTGCETLSELGKFTEPSKPDVSNSWLAYSNEEIGFSFMYPKDAEIVKKQKGKVVLPDGKTIETTSLRDNEMKIKFPFLKETVIKQKYLGIRWDEDLENCGLQNGEPQSGWESVIVNGTELAKRKPWSTKELFSKTIRSGIGYVAPHNNKCIRIGFILVTAIADDQGNETEESYLENEMKIFDEVAKTIKLL